MNRSNSSSKSSVITAPVAGALLAGTFAASGLAADRTWVGLTGLPPGDGTTFDAPLNWSPNAVPGPADRAIFTLVGGTILMPGVATTNERLLVRGPLGGVLLNLNAGIYLLNAPGTLGDARSMVVGLDPGDVASLVLTNGTVVGESAGVGVALGTTGTLEIDSGAVLLLNGDLGVGEGGLGTLSVLGTLVTQQTILGESLVGNGSATIDGLAGLWLALGPVVIGDGGTAELNVINGGKLIANDSLLSAVQPGSSATILIRDPGSIALVTGGVVIGGDQDFAGGSVLVSLDNDGLLRVTPDLTVRVGGTLDIVQSRVETPAIEIDGGDAIVNVAGTLVVSEVGSINLPGIFVGLDGGTGQIAISNGGTLTSSQGVVAGDAASAGEMVVEGAGSNAQFSGALSIGSPSQPLERNGRRGRVAVADQAMLKVNSSLLVGQRGEIDLFGGTVETQMFTLGDEGVVRVDLPQAGTGVVSTMSAFAGGLASIRLPGRPPLVGETFDILKAPFIFGNLAVVSSPDLAGDRSVTLQKVNVPGGEALRLKIELLPLQFTFQQPGATDVDLPPADVVVASFVETDELPQVGISVPAANPNNPGTVRVLANTASPRQQPDYNPVAVVPVGKNPGALVQGSLFNTRGSKGVVPDLAVSNRGSNSITLVRNNTPAAAAVGGPPFIVEAELVVDGVPAGLGIGDLDGDGTPESPNNDIVVAVASTAPQEPGFLAIFYNQNGSFSPTYQQLTIGIDPQTVDPIDTTGDKQKDLVAVNFGMANPTKPIEGPCVTINFNFGNGIFCDPPKVYEVGKGPIAAAAADLNDDGYLDLVTANSLDGTISVLVGKELGISLSCLDFDPFLPAIDLDAGGIPVALAVANFNLVPGEGSGDSDIDIAVLVEDPVTGEQKLNLFRNDSAYGQIVLTLLTNVQTPIGLPFAATAADTDGDGDPDVVTVGKNLANGVAGLNEGFISVFLAVPTCPGDLAGDGVVDGGDLGAILAAWGSTGPNVPEDINGDGIVDAADLGLLLQNWGMCGGG